MDRVVNWELLRNPYNWVIVALMLAIATFALHLLLGNGGGLALATGSAAADHE